MPNNPSSSTAYSEVSRTKIDTLERRMDKYDAILAELTAQQIRTNTLLEGMEKHSSYFEAIIADLQKTSIDVGKAVVRLEGRDESTQWKIMTAIGLVTLVIGALLSPLISAFVNHLIHP